MKVHKVEIKGIVCYTKSYNTPLTSEFSCQVRGSNQEFKFVGKNEHIPTKVAFIHHSGEIKVEGIVKNQQYTIDSIITGSFDKTKVLMRKV